jgi:NTE family protein
MASTEDQCEYALCLSGGGYRAMLFHLGALWRLNELGYLEKLDRVSSVSGGSIAAGVLAKHWDALEFDGGRAGNFAELVAADIHSLAMRTIDAWAVLRGLAWFGPIGDRVAAAYKRHVFGGMKLSDLPDEPRFVFNATNLQTGSLWRFSKPYMADYKVGQVLRPELELATAVAASSAFPPFLSPLKLKLREGEVVGFPGQAEDPPFFREPYTREVVLSDGGVYDNLGLQTASQCQVLLVSDGGGYLKSKKRPWRFWPMHTYRVLNVIDSQVRALRASHLVERFAGRKARQEVPGALWTIRTPIAKYALRDALPVSERATDELAAVKTRLGRLRPERQQQLVNWGYAACDASLRSNIGLPAAAPPRFPYPDAPLAR